MGKMDCSAGSSSTFYIDVYKRQPLSELVDLEKEKARLQGEKDKAEQNLQRILGKLQNESFVSKAPAHVVEA